MVVTLEIHLMDRIIINKELWLKIEVFERSEEQWITCCDMGVILRQSLEGRCGQSIKRENIEKTVFILQ